MACIIFDIDGTIADVEHRLQWVRSNPKNWNAFNAAMVDDKVYNDVTWLLKTLHAAGCKILIASGRNGEDRAITENWLNTVAGLDGLYEKLYMRPLADRRADDIIKSEILDQMYEDGYTPTMVIDDRPSVLRMWRSRGLTTFAVGDLVEF